MNEFGNLRVYVKKNKAKTNKQNGVTVWLVADRDITPTQLLKSEVQVTLPRYLIPGSNWSETLPVSLILCSNWRVTPPDLLILHSNWRVTLAGELMWISKCHTLCHVSQKYPTALWLTVFNVTLFKGADFSPHSLTPKQVHTCTANLYLVLILTWEQGEFRTGVFAKVFCKELCKSILTTGEK